MWQLQLCPGFCPRTLRCKYCCHRPAATLSWTRAEEILVLFVTLRRVAAAPILTGGRSVSFEAVRPPRNGCCVVQTGEAIRARLFDPIKGGHELATIGHAIDFVGSLSQKRLDRHCWYGAVVVLNTAFKSHSQQRRLIRKPLSLWTSCSVAAR